jgi:uncharacterized protein (DUF697 family)
MTQLDQKTDEFNQTEAHVWREIKAFKNQNDGLRARFQQGVDEKLDDVATKLQQTTSGETTEKTIDAVISVLNDASSWTLRPEKIWENFQEEGLSVSDLDDVRGLELDEIEKVVDNLDRKYNSIAFAQGTATGAAGLPGALADLPALVGLCLRAINEYAISYGFDIDNADERAMAVLTLAAAASSGESRGEMFERIEKHARTTHGQRSHRGEVPEPIMDEVAKELVVRLARGSLAQALPLVGALVGGGINRAFVKHVCETARRVYEERWLMRRYEFGEQSG